MFLIGRAWRCGLTHDVHSAELRPHLNTHSKNNTLEDTGFREFSVRRNSFLAFKTNDLLDLLILRKHLRVVKISASVDVGENTESFIPSVLVGQPTWGFWEEE